MFKAVEQKKAVEGREASVDILIDALETSSDLALDAIAMVAHLDPSGQTMDMLQARAVARLQERRRQQPDAEQTANRRDCEEALETYFRVALNRPVPEPALLRKPLKLV